MAIVPPAIRGPRMLTLLSGCFCVRKCPESYSKLGKTKAACGYWGVPRIRAHLLEHNQLALSTKAPAVDCQPESPAHPNSKTNNKSIPRPPGHKRGELARAGAERLEPSPRRAGGEVPGTAFLLSHVPSLCKSPCVRFNCLWWLVRITHHPKSSAQVVLASESHTPKAARENFLLPNICGSSRNSMSPR